MHRSADLSSPQARGDLAAMYNQLGYLSSAESGADAAVAYRQAAAEFERLADDEPQVLRWQKEWANALNNLAALAAQTGRLDEAEALYDRAVGLQGKLVERAPQVVMYLRDLAVSQNNFGYLLSQRGRYDAAIEQFENARLNLSRLASAHDKSPEYASRLGAIYNNLGLACEGQGMTDRAQAAYSDAIDWQRKALELSPHWQQAQAYLDSHTANLQRLLQASNQARSDGSDSSPHAESDVPAGKQPIGAILPVAQMTTEQTGPLERDALLDDTVFPVRH